MSFALDGKPRGIPCGLSVPVVLLGAGEPEGSRHGELRLVQVGDVVDEAQQLARYG